jgi:hypothetical protein
MRPGTPPKSTRHSFNLMNELAEFDDMAEIFDNFRLNQLVLLVKTFNSWNALAPIGGHERDPQDPQHQRRAGWLSSSLRWAISSMIPATCAW